jgi:hypothetical protein
MDPPRTEESHFIINIPQIARNDPRIMAGQLQEIPERFPVSITERVDRCPAQT